MRKIGWAVLAALATSSACSSAPSNNDAEQICVDTINSYRAQLGLPAYKRWTTNESCADSQAKSDSETNIPHGAFSNNTCPGNAQNECPGWPGPPEQMIPQCLAMMWAEGPGTDFNTHGHYLNMSSTSFTKVACGFFTMSDGTTVWAVQDFQ
jgi:hypothetical protein